MTRWRFARVGAAMTFAALMALGSPSPPALAQELRLVVGGPSGSEAYRLAEILAGPLGEALGRPAAPESVAGDDGVAAAKAVVEAAPDGDTLLLADNLLLALNEATGDRPFAIDALRPLAKLTLGLSVALVAPANSDITSWQALLDRAEQGTLTLSVAESEAAHAVARAMVEGATGISFEVVEAADNAVRPADVAAGRADLAIVTTNSIEDHNAAAEVALRPIVTFGAKRSPLYPDTPTFAELSGDDKNDFTYSFAIFGPAGLSDQVAATTTAAIQSACGAPEAVVAASAAELPLACHDAEIVHETIERDLGVARRVAAHLEED